MSSFGIGVYFLSVIWFITLMLCWVSVRTGHYIGKVSVAVSFVLTIVLISMPKGDAHHYSANFYDRLFVLRYAVLSLLLASCVGGSVFLFIHVCLTPIETRKVRSFGIVN